MRRKLRATFESVLPPSISLNGENDCDPQIHDDRFYESVCFRGTLGLGESYIKGWWDCRALDQLFEQLLRAGFLERSKNFLDAIVVRLREKFLNEQRPSLSRKIAEHHYDLGNTLFEAFLDPNNQYSCGYFEGTQDLNVAQVQKLRLICRKLELRPGDRVLDIGCGWGGFAKFASRNFGCHVTGISISDPQVQYARKFCSGLPVEIRNCDYRELKGQFDKVLSCGMIEHVGHKNYRVIMETVERCLHRDGLFLLHTIGKGEDGIPLPDPWIVKYIFPGGMLPTPTRIARAAEGLFDAVDFQEFGMYYDPTLMAWAANFENNWPKISSQYDERFHRMWRYYLLTCAATFRVRKPNLWQYVFRKKGGPGYLSVRNVHASSSPEEV